MSSRLTVVLLSLLVAIPTVIFWLWLVILPEILTIECPEECSCDELGFEVNCTGSILENVPSDLPTHVRLLRLDCNGIPLYESGTFVSPGVFELETLLAEFCKIKDIELGAFNGLTMLAFLSMGGNELNEIMPGTFEKLRSLEVLQLDNNRIEYLDSGVFSGLVDLKIIDLRSNKLQYLHPDMFLGLPKLQRLYLSRNVELQIPTDRHFIDSLSLNYLSVSDCSVTSVTVETFAKIRALEKLDLSDNNLRSMDINILKVLPKLSALYLYYNPLHCDCQLQEVWQWCDDHNIKSALWGTVPVCDTPKEVKTLWWGVLEKAQCLQGNIHYYGDYKSTNHNYTSIEDMDMDLMMETNTETVHDYSFFEQYLLLVPAVLFMLGTTGNVIIIIIITCNKDMRTVPNMYILNLAVSDMIILTFFLTEFFLSITPLTLLVDGFMCFLIPFCYRISISVTSYSVAVLSIQRYRITVDPLHTRVSSQRTWRATGVTICLLWIVAALFALPTGLSRKTCVDSLFLWRTNYNQQVALFELLVSCALPLCVIAFSYIMMVRRLLENPPSLFEDRQNPRLNTRRKTAKVVLGLTVIFLISFVPHHILGTYFHSNYISENYSTFYSDKFGWGDELRNITLFLQCLLPLNSCFNPVALCCTGPAFRRHFKRYLICCCKTNSPPTDFNLQ